MDTINVLLIINAALCGILTLLLAQNWWLNRTFRKLNKLLTSICVTAYMIRHTAVWEAWCEYSQHDIEVEVTTRPRKLTKGTSHGQ